MKIQVLIIVFVLKYSLIETTERSFSIDYKNNCFVKDGQPFRYVSGSLHYFRVPSVLWVDRMIKYRAAGLNAIQTYIEWSSHEPEPGVYDFDGDNNLFEFLRIANQQNLSVILRAGPFIDAERDFGGFPYWLLSIDRNIKLRSSDPKYIKEVDKWYSYLLPKLRPYLYNRGGPVVMVQIENEFGSFGCDFEYLTHLRDLFTYYLGKDVVLFTTDGNNDGALQCGKIDGVFATVDFGPDSNVSASFSVQKRHQEFGPNVNSEYYPGWLDYWGRPHSVTNTSSVCNTIDEILSLNGSVNVYMFHGGTSFGFTAGSNMDSGAFWACPTSYDYDAPLSEAGDPTPKYYAMRKYMPLHDIPVPIPAPKMETNPILMTPVSDIIDFIGETNERAVSSLYPMTFEELRQRNGFVLYSTNITFRASDPALLKINGLGDRAQVFVNWKFMGTLSRTQKAMEIPLNLRQNSTLHILVENEGRICSGPALIGDFKGIISNVTVGPKVLTNWDHFRIRFDDMEGLRKNLLKNKGFQSFDQTIPTFYWGEFQLESGRPLLDTFLKVDGWGKGIAFLNGFNLGRYWPITGPQMTLYSPKHLFKPYPELNSLVLFELEGSPCYSRNKCSAQFVKTHVINGSTPYQTINTFDTIENQVMANEFGIQLNDIHFI